MWRVNERKICVCRTSSSVSFREVSSLDHKVLDHSVEHTAFVPFTLGLFGKLHEVLHRLRDSFTEKADFNPAGVDVADFDIEPYLQIQLIREQISVFGNIYHSVSARFGTKPVFHSGSRCRRVGFFHPHERQKYLSRRSRAKGQRWR